MILRTVRPGTEVCSMPLEESHMRKDSEHCIKGKLCEL